jgi:hypothetical protein
MSQTHGGQPANVEMRPVALAPPLRVGPDGATPVTWLRRSRRRAGPSRDPSSRDAVCGPQPLRPDPPAASGLRPAAVARAAADGHRPGVRVNIWNPIHMDKNGQIGMYRYILVHDGTTWYILTYCFTYLYILVHTKIIFSRMVHTCMYCILTPSHILHCGAVIWCSSNTGPLSHAQHMILFCLK